MNSGLEKALLVFDVTDASSFASLSQWVEEVIKGKMMVVAVCANKVLNC